VISIELTNLDQHNP